METPFCQNVDNHVQAYESPLNDPTREIAMRSAEAHVISLQHLVDNSNEERQKGEYMYVSSLLLLTQAQHRQGEEPMDNTADRSKTRHINECSDACASIVIVGGMLSGCSSEKAQVEGCSMRVWNRGTMEHSVRICVFVSNSRLAPKDETLTNVNAQGRELFLSFKVRRQSTGSWKVITIQSWIAGNKSIQSMEISG
jgi:hypothetical protein